MLGSTLMDADVVNAEGDDMGDVEDVLLYPAGRLRGMLMEVCGFLGIGEKVIAVDFKRLKIRRDEDDKFVAVLRASEDELEDAPAFVTRTQAEEIAEERAEAAEAPLEKRAQRLEERAAELEERAETVEQRTEQRVEKRVEQQIEEEVLQ